MPIYFASQNILGPYGCEYVSRSGYQYDIYRGSVCHSISPTQYNIHGVGASVASVCFTEPCYSSTLPCRVLKVTPSNESLTQCNSARKNFNVSLACRIFIREHFDLFREKRSRRDCCVVPSAIFGMILRAKVIRFIGYLTLWL